MREIIIPLVIAGLLTATGAMLPARAVVQERKQADTGENIRKEINRLSREKPRVKITRLDGNEMIGNIADVSADDFALVERTTKQTTRVPYADVAKVERHSSGKRSTWITMGIVGTVATVVVFTVLKRALR